jgi:hypothetical protein
VTHRHAGNLLRSASSVNLGTDALEAGQVVHPQGDRDAVLALQLPRQAPADADVAVVIDNTAKQRKIRGWMIPDYQAGPGNQEYQNFAGKGQSKNHWRGLKARWSTNKKEMS